MPEASELPLPGIDVAAVDDLSGAWDDGGLWADVVTLARRFAADPDPVTRAVAWHHFVLAVGNFKRESGRRLRVPLPPLEAAAVPGTVLLPGTDPPFYLCADDPTSWRTLESALPGAGTATTTALLAALWPDTHFVFDWRVAAAATGLRAAAGLPLIAGIEATGTNSRPINLDDYVKVRAWVAATAEITRRPLAAVERALYTLSQTVGDEADRNWVDYGYELRSRLSP